ncbi:MAG: sugar nucleotide-binding protein [Clostridia bacterium]|nr:sugar nucleotide-binding protein [Clostridia bacterium]
MILVTGASGFVGNKIMQTCKDVIACPSLRGASEDDVRRIVGENNVDAIIHTAAIANMNVCEENPDESYYANVLLPVYLAKASKNIKLVCFSSDQVYNGTVHDGPYVEGMENPINVYGKHKLEMEKRVLDINPDAVMLRAEWMYDNNSSKLNFFSIITSASGTVSHSSKYYRGLTYVKEVAENMENVIRLPGGSYNFGSETTKPMYDISKEFLEFLGRDVEVIDKPPIHNLWMNCEKARKGGVDFSETLCGLKKCAIDYGFAK